MPVFANRMVNNIKMLLKNIYMLVMQRSPHKIRQRYAKHLMLLSNVYLKLLVQQGGMEHNRVEHQC